MSASLEHNDLSYKAFAGYRFNPYLAAEGSYNYLGRTRVSDTTNDTFRVNENSYRIGSDGDADIETRSFGLAAVLSYPTSWRLTPFAKIGAHLWTTRGSGSGDFSVVDSEDGSSTTDVDVFLGLGGEYPLSETLAVRGEWEWFSVNASSINNFSVSMLYRF